MHHLLVLAACVALALACWADLAARLIPDRAPATLAAAGAGLQALQGGAGAAALALLAALLLLALAAGAWRRGLMGGGDVKLLAGAALLAGWQGVPALLLGTAVLGGLLALPYLLARRPGAALPPAGRAAGRLRRVLRAEARRLRRGGPLPYGLAIAGGAALSLATPGVLP
ncbi:prepilin peptidase [Roseococcus sp. DSY-14]|uniref:prepilin peptidase n=1 Tax=Roseococcus sp. DSY-14 TaxID=3369650 RepID=UPI00387ABFE6